MTSFFEHIQFQARSRPKATAIIGAKALVTYEELLARANGMARLFVQHGLRPGEILALNLHEPVSHCAAIIGAMGAGIPTLSVAGTRPVLPQDVPISAILSDLPVVSVPAGIRILKLADGDQAAEPRVAPRSGRPAGNVARIFCTEGRPGKLKAVALTEEQLMHRVETQIVGLRAFVGPSRTLGMMGLSTGAGFINMLTVLMTGGALMLARSVPQLAKTAAIHRMDRIVASTAQLIAILRAAENDGADFAGIRSLVVGGGDIPRAMLKSARAICRDIICLYGSTEMGVVASAPAEIIVKQRSAAGFVVPGVTVEIVDEKNNVLDSGREGFVRIRAPHAPIRYVNDEEATGTAFRDGWYYPGDIGTLSAAGLLCVSGRASDRIDVGGMKIAPRIIEDVIGSRPEIADVGAFEFVNAQGVSELAVAIVPREPAENGNIDRAGLRQYFQKQLGERTPKRWIIVKAIPRNERGKIDRIRLTEIARRRLALAA